MLHPTECVGASATFLGLTRRGNTRATRVDKCLVMAPHHTNPRNRSGATTVAVPAGLIRSHDLMVAAPAVLAILAGVLVRAI